MFLHEHNSTTNDRVGGSICDKRGCCTSFAKLIRKIKFVHESFFSNDIYKTMNKTPSC